MTYTLQNYGRIDYDEEQHTVCNIYKLLWNTIVGGVASFESEDDATKLWLVCLGHLIKL